MDHILSYNKLSNVLNNLLNNAFDEVAKDECIKKNKELIELVCSGDIERIIINYKDRLVRFGYEILEQVCNLHGVKIEIINFTEDKTYEQELVEDVLSIITVFSSRLYGSRSHKSKKILNDNKELFE